MKVLGIVCSPRKGGNTEILVEEALASARDCGAETDLFTIQGKDIKPCDACYSCRTTGKCHIKDDMQDLYAKLLDANGIIWGTPIYFYDVAAQTKMLIDRSLALFLNNKLTNKVGGVISVASSLGHVSVWNLFNAFFSSNHMLSADLVFGFAREKGDIRKDKHALKASRELGRQVVLMAEQQFQFPEEYDAPLYRFINKKYGIDQCPAMGRFDG